MSKTYFELTLVVILGSVFCQGSPVNREGFIYIGSGVDLHAKASRYYLSNIQDTRDIYDARVGCHDGWNGGELVSIETATEETTIRFLLSSNGITDATRVWTTGQHAGPVNGWIWYNYATGDTPPIENVEGRPWAGGIVPNFGCLSVGGRDWTYGWQSWDCSLKRRYLCEVEDWE